MKHGNINSLVNGTEQIVFDYTVQDADLYTKLLLHCNGTNGGTTFTDVTGKTVTPNGNVNTSTTEKKFGTASAYFDGNGDYLSIPNSSDFAFGSGDFTIDCWIYLTEIKLYNEIYYHADFSNPGENQIYITIVNGYTHFGEVVNNVPTVSISDPNIISLNEWHHIAVVRNGNNFNLYVDGVSVASQIYSSALVTRQDVLRIGSLDWYTPSSFHGYIDEFRISKGIARWTSNFTPPTIEYVGGPVSSISTGNILNGDEDGEYTVLLFKAGTCTPGHAYLRLNGDSGTNYGSRGIQAYSSTYSDFSGNNQIGIPCGYTTTSGYNLISIVKINSKSGYPRFINVLSTGDINGTTVTTLTDFSSVWNNFIDNIQSISWEGHSGATIGVGSRIIILKNNNFTGGKKTGTITTPYIKGTWVNIGNVTLANPATEIEFPTVDGDRDILYKVNFKGKWIGGSGGPQLLFNNDNTNYAYRRLTAESTNIYSSANTASAFACAMASYGDNGYGNYTAIFYGSSGNIKAGIILSDANILGTTIYQSDIIGSVYNNLNKITNIKCVVSAGQMAAGTQVELYALRPNG